MKRKGVRIPDNQWSCFHDYAAEFIYKNINLHLLTQKYEWIWGIYWDCWIDGWEIGWLEARNSILNVHPKQTKEQKSPKSCKTGKKTSGK